MARALKVAETALGQVAPNPAVACLIVQDGCLIALGTTQAGGRPHAETQALAQAKEKTKSVEGADIYITLEPCAHQGQTPPCVDALIEAKPARVICALQDPDRQVNGAGFAALKKAGIKVVENVLQDEAAFLNAGYLLHRKEKRPLVSWKTGSTLDGRIATAAGNSRWITNETSRAFGHSLRANHDAVIIGSRTGLGDNPELTCRLSGLEGRTPIRIVADSHLSIPLTSKLVESAREHPVWVFCRAESDKLRYDALKESGVKLIETSVDSKTGLLDCHEMLGLLAQEGITRLLIEGGSHLSASFMRAKLVDRIYWFGAPKILGDDGTATIAGMGLERLSDANKFTPLWRQAISEDTLIVLGAQA